MRSVGAAECIAYIVICKISQFFCKALSCFFRLGLFLASETGILQKDDVSVLHLGNSLGCCLSGNIVIGDELDFLAELLGQACGNRCQRLALVRALLYFAKMGAEDDLCAFPNQLVDGGECSNDTGLVGDLPVLQRYVEIAADKDSLSLCVDVINGLLIQHWNMPP